MRPQTQPLTRTELLEKAPSIFATKSADRTSNIYNFIPTTRVLDELEKNGWQAIDARESRANEENRGYQKHMIRLRHPDFSQSLTQIGQTVPEMLLTNSHDGKAAYHFHAGLFRLVCENGLVLCDETFEKIAVRHVGYSDSDVIEASFRVIKEVPKMLESVEKLQSVKLSTDERQAFAKSASMLKWDEGEAPVTPLQLLKPRRWGDKETDLYTTFNVVQENLIRGGLRYTTKDERTPEGRLIRRGRRNKTRQVTAIDTNIKLNKALHRLAIEMAGIKAA